MSSLALAGVCAGVCGLRRQAHVCHRLCGCRLWLIADPRPEDSCRKAAEGSGLKVSPRVRL